MPVDVHHPPLEEAATPAYVLGVLRDLHRQDLRWAPETKRGIAVWFDSLVDELAVLFDVMSWQEAGRRWNCILEIDVSHADWKEWINRDEWEAEGRSVSKRRARHSVRHAVLAVGDGASTRPGIVPTPTRTTTNQIEKVESPLFRSFSVVFFF